MKHFGFIGAAMLLTLSACHDSGIRPPDEEIATLRDLCSTFDGEGVKARIEEYSDANIRFHQAILRMSKCKLLYDLTQDLFMHVRAIRARTIFDQDRADWSIVDHMHIIEALEARDTELAERLVREHNLNLKDHVEKYVDLD